MVQTVKKTKHLSHIIRVVVAIAAFLYFVIRNDPKGIIRDFGELHISVFLMALVLYIAGNLIFVLRWLVLLGTQGVRVGYWPALKLHLLGLFYNNCLPGSVGGDILRAWYVAKHTEKKIEAAMSVFVDRAIGLVCTIAMAFLAYWFIPADGAQGKLQFGTQLNPASLAIKFLLGIVVLIILAALAVALMYYNRKWRAVLFKYGFILALRWSFWVGRIVKAVKLYCCKPFILLLAVVMTFVCQALPIYGLYLVGRDLGVEAHIKYYFIFFPLSWIIGVIPISVGGAGVMEFGIQGMFKVIGVAGRIPTLALAQRITWLLTSIPGVIIHITGKHLPGEFKNKD
ncbi:MAG: lysylphosphatidylglycerol synthase transmembrane domain-containing protein [Phycisphaerae bacterium]|nr:lysylphosphatidylglycerol synthase transmembrane domain-containing protein [Phycisphaerae bacterium]